jgi:phosphatidylserine decarboxylase
MNNYIAYAPEALIVPAIAATAAIYYRSFTAAMIAVIMLIIMLYFYRGATFAVESSATDILISPCEGTVLGCVREQDHLRISTFLNVHNRHIQYAPIDGRITNIVHKDGQFNPAYMFEKSRYNERVETTIMTRAGPIQVVQIAGQVARRIVSMCHVGEDVAKGQPLGLIKFGSRVDVIVPFVRAKEVFVSAGDKIRVGDPLLRIM